MPKAFEDCIKNGGKVRTKSIGNDKFMRICFIGGKSYSGEIENKKESNMNDLSLVYKFNESQVDQKSRLVACGVLEENCLSANNRFYPASVVREAISKLSGKQSLIGHDTNSPMDVVAKIEKAEMVGKLGVGHFKFGTDPVSEAMLTKIKDGLVNSVSIRAIGESKRAKIDGQFVDVVEKLDIRSVDFVVEGGVDSAKVIRVFESSPQIENLTDDKNEDNKKLEEEMEIKEMEKQLKELTEKLSKSEQEKNQIKEEKLIAELKAYVEKKVSQIQDAEMRDLVREQLTGKSTNEIDAQYEKQLKVLEKIQKRIGVKEDFIIKPADSKHEETNKKFKNVNELLESSVIDEKDKLLVIKACLGEKN